MNGKVQGRRSKAEGEVSRELCVGDNVRVKGFVKPSLSRRLAGRKGRIVSICLDLERGHRADLGAGTLPVNFRAHELERA